MKSLSPSQPHAIIMVGLPGSGKSFFADKFAETFNAPYVAIDTLVPLARDMAAADEILLSMVKEIAKTRGSLIVDAEASSRVRRTELAKIFREHGYTPLFVWVQTDTETSRQRTLRAKTLDASGFDAAVKRFSQPHESEHAAVISGKHTYASQAKIILKHLSIPRTVISSHTQAPVRPGRITIR